MTTELEELRERAAQLEAALAAVRNGDTLASADRPYRAMVESMGEGAVTVSEHGVILFANAQLAKFLGVERDSMVGRDFASYVAEEQRPALVSLLAPKETETRRGALSLARPGGTVVPFLVAATDLNLDGALVCCLVLTDLSMHKLVEQQALEETARTQGELVAREVNDTIVQGLVAAEMALDLGRVDYARSVIARTSSQARSLIGDLAGALSEDHQLTPGMALRSAASRQAPGTP